MPLLQISNLKKSYAAPDGGTHVVVDVPEFKLEAQAQIALSGESGSGKTTFLNLIAGILAPDTGSIQLNGQELAGLPESARDRVRATSIGYIFQTFNLLQGYTALEKVLLGMSFGPGAEVAATQLDRRHHDLVSRDALRRFDVSAGTVTGDVCPQSGSFVAPGSPSASLLSLGTNVNEGIGKVLRFGAYSPDVMQRLRWMAEVLAAQSRDAAAPTFSPDGLYFLGPVYGPEWGLPSQVPGYDALP